jgi:hypothetical protein
MLKCLSVWQIAAAKRARVCKYRIDSRMVGNAEVIYLASR